MSKSHALAPPKNRVWWCLVLSGACEFGGDRSLGTIVLPPALSADASVIALPQAGATGGTTILITLPPSCNPVAQPSECAEGQLCTVNLTCGRGTEPIRGYCHERPVECGTPSGYERVCGCNRQFYDSRCLALRDGVSIAALSECESIPCLSNADCDRFADSCVDIYGMSVKGAVCYDSECICAGTAVTA